MSVESKGYDVVDFAQIEAQRCPCGWARRSLMDDSSVPYSLHVTDILEDARTHYHRRITETYFFLECSPEARMELNGKSIPVRPHTAIVIRPGTRHRAVGKMRVVIIASPKFDASDEWFDE
ncbi:MAG: cupin [Pirellulaceae bacterium]|nr:MAG: cupin [Pirellulaceae bacterium]